MLQIVKVFKFKKVVISVLSYKFSLQEKGMKKRQTLSCIASSLMRRSLRSLCTRCNSSSGPASLGQLARRSCDSRPDRCTSQLVSSWLVRVWASVSVWCARRSSCRACCVDSRRSAITRRSFSLFVSDFCSCKTDIKLTVVISPTY